MQVQFGILLQDLLCSLQLLHGMVWMGLEMNIEDCFATDSDLDTVFHEV